MILSLLTALLRRISGRPPPPKRCDQFDWNDSLAMSGTLLSPRKESIVATLGREGEMAAPRSHTGKSLAVFTSGGDSQGMNAAVRSVVRMGLYLGCRVYFIREGYQGMVDGGANITEAAWNSVSDIIQQGGTIIGSARCKDFRTREGRLKACEHLISHHITNLVCIGGDGSLTGANQFRIDWPGLVKELVDTGRITQDVANKCSNINIVGLVGSIDNDFCGTDMTIGTDSALHRIVEAVDCVNSTAQSHQRSFVIEVMGRHCGYLALVAAQVTEADFVFIPEWPPGTNWQDVLCKKLEFARENGQRLNIVMVAEGAIDREGNAISAVDVKDTIVKRLGYDTRVTVLGHVQRGGNPSAFDRLLGCRMGAEAVLALMEMTPDSEPSVISIDGNQMVRVPLMQCVERTKAVQEAMDKKEFERAVELRGRSFKRNLETYMLFTKMQAPDEIEHIAGGRSFNLAVLNVGAPACGMNACVRAIVRMSLYHNCKIFGVQDSFDGLADGRLKSMSWTDVIGWTMQGGSNLGTQKQVPDAKSMPEIASTLQKFNIQGLVIIGGFEAFHSGHLLAENRDKYLPFRIPMVVVPCVISNNVPGTNFSIGSDTSLNEICGIIDKIKQSASGVKRRVFIIETMGGYCGYLATLSALASGADNAYIHEEPFSVDDLKADIGVMAHKMQKGVQRYLVMRNEFASRNYTTDFLQRLFSEESRGAFTTKINVLGHMQQGGHPSAFDRNMSTKLGGRATEHVIRQIAERMNDEKGEVSATDAESCCVLGLVGRKVEMTPIQQVSASGVDFVHRRPTQQWWLKLRPLMRILSKHHDTYQAMGIAGNVK